MVDVATPATSEISFLDFLFSEAWDAMYIAAAATDIGDLPETRSRSTALLAMVIAAFSTSCCLAIVRSK